MMYSMGVGYSGGIVGSLVTFILTCIALYYVLTGRGERIRYIILFIPLIALSFFAKHSPNFFDMVGSENYK